MMTKLNFEQLVTDMAKHFIEMGKVDGFREYAEKRYVKLKEQSPWLHELIHKRIIELKEKDK